jgi:glycosyltransferase involved in cell wall biosynthesis
MNIKITGCADARDGYGEITQSLSLALDKLGHNVWFNPVKIWYNKESLEERTLQLLKPNKPDFEFIVMYPTFKFENVHSKVSIMTMYEANKCPNEWVSCLNNLGIPIFAPSRFVLKMFKESGVNVPIKILPLGINSFYKLKLRTYPEDRPFRFLMLGKLEPRKNTEVAVRAFLQAFQNNESVELIIKTRERFNTSFIRMSSLKDPRIKIIEKTLSLEDLMKLYYYCDVFVYPSRGEGFGFPPRNAIATGLPTIVTNWSALSEIPGAIKIPINGLSPMPPCGFSYGQEKELLMADISENILSLAMHRLYSSETWYNKAALATAEVKQLSWEDSAKEFINLVKGRI